MAYITKVSPMPTSMKPAFLLIEAIPTPMLLTNREEFIQFRNVLSFAKKTLGSTYMIYNEMEKKYNKKDMYIHT